MSRIAIAFSNPRSIGFIEEQDRPVTEQEVRVRTLYSGISSGTELTAFRGTHPKLHKRWDESRRLFIDDPRHETIAFPVVGWGYEEVGEVVEVGAGAQDSIPLGSIVYGSWGHRTEQIVDASYARDHLLPAHVDPLLGIFSAIGATALNAILDSAIRLGETVAVFGLGVVGQLVAQLAQLSGAEVIGVDLLPLRLEIAQRAGIDHVIDGAAGSPAEQIKELTRGRGADVCIEASGTTAGLNEAIRACAYSSKVVAVSFYQGEARGLFLGDEFNYNRINLVYSQVAGCSPELQHRWNHARLVQTFMSLVARDRLNLHPLITHVMPAAQAPALFKLVDEQPGDVLQAVLDFREAVASTR